MSLEEGRRLVDSASPLRRWAGHRLDMVSTNPSLIFIPVLIFRQGLHLPLLVVRLSIVSLLYPLIVDSTVPFCWRTCRTWL